MKETQLTRQKYNQNSRFYNLTEFPMEISMFKRWRKQFFNNLSGKRILEIGVGTGKNLNYYPDDVMVTAVDLSEGMMEKARPIAEAKGISLAQMDAQHLGFADNTFDVVIATFVFCSVPDPIAGFREIKRVLKPEGEALFMEHVLPENSLLAWAFNRLNSFTVARGGVHINRQTADNIRKAGLQISSEKNLFATIFKRFSAIAIK